MLFLQSFKDAAHGFVSCCDRPQTGSNFGPRSVDDSYQHATPSKRQFSRLRTWPMPPSPTGTQQKARWTVDRKAVLGRTQQYEEEKKKDRSSNIEEPDDNNITQRVFTYDIILFGNYTEKVVYRRLKLDFQVQFDAVSDEIPRLLNIPVTSYGGAEVQLPNGHWVKPSGAIEVKWQLYKGQNQYKTEFLVIENSPFDMLLGRPSIHSYRLWEEDNDIQERLQCS
ncbi:hypothetical protein BDW75DRAFT_208278 [Aspergillus navahoensis]